MEGNGFTIQYTTNFANLTLNFQLCVGQILDSFLEPSARYQNIPTHGTREAKRDHSLSFDNTVLRFPGLAVQEDAVSFVSAPRVARPYQLHDGAPGIVVITDGTRTQFVLRRRRHDLPPVEASQILGPDVGNITVGHNQVFSAVVVQIGEF